MSNIKDLQYSMFSSLDILCQTNMAFLNVFCGGGLHPSQEYYSHEGTFSCVPALNQYLAEDHMSCSNTQHSDSGESQTSDPLILMSCLFDLILYVPSTIFQLYRDRSSWVEPVLS